jgi:ABC-type phosphate/phosphonate transport system substrate-binding protein
MRPLDFACVACILLLVARVGAQSEPVPRNVRIGTIVEVYSGENISDVQAAMQLWINTLARKAGDRYKGMAVMFKTVEEALEVARRGELEAVNLSAIDFLQAGEQAALEPMMVGVFADGTTMQEFVLLVRNDGGIGKLADLQGKKLLVNRLDWQIARLWLEVLLCREGLPDSGVHLGKIASVEGASKQVLPVFFGQVDACIVTATGFATLAELNPQLGRELTVVARSPALLLYLGCLVPGLDEELCRDFMDMAQSLHRDSSGRQLLALFGLERTVPFKMEYLESLKELVAEYAWLTDRRRER